MSVLVYAENWEGQFKKATYEAVSYAYDAAQKLDKELVTLVAGQVEEEEINKLGTYGASKVIRVSDERLSPYQTKPMAKVVESITNHIGADLLIFGGSFNGKSLAPRAAVKLNAGIVTGVTDGINTANGIMAKKSVFSNKGFAYVKFHSDIKIISIAPNSFGVQEHGNDVTIEDQTVELSEADFDIVVVEQEKIKGQVPLTEAEKVISGGRGLKSPENWHLIEDLASVIGASTACSKPVSDMEWRPHSEHVGQTGTTIRPDLYLSVGISGAIQHQAGVNSSKVIAVINKDPEAPFFKIADYGIVGDAFEVLPKLTEAARKKKGVE